MFSLVRRKRRAGAQAQAECGGERVKREVSTRDHTVPFMELRAVARRAERTELDRVTSKVELARFTMECAREEAGTRRAAPPSSVSGILSSWWGSGASGSPAVDAADLDSTADCPVCKKKLFGRVHGRKLCELCATVVCSDCAGPRDRIELSVGRGPTQLSKSLSVCKRCYVFHSKWRAREQREQQRIADRDHPLVKFYSVITDIRDCIVRALPKYVAILKRITDRPNAMSAEDYEAATKLEQSLVGFFENLKIAIKRVNEIEVRSPREKMLQGNFARTLFMLQKEHYPHFRVLQGERKLIKNPPSGAAAHVLSDSDEELDLAPAPPESGSLATAPVSSTSASASASSTPPAAAPVTRPRIVSIEPLISPLAGTELVLTGRYFTPHSSVKVGRRFCQCHCKDEETLFVSAPAMDAGLYPVSVMNADGQCHEMQPILLYTDEFSSKPAAPAAFSRAASAAASSRAGAGGARPSQRPVAGGFGGGFSSDWGDLDGGSASPQHAAYDGWGGDTSAAPVRQGLYDDRQPAVVSVSPLLSPLEGTRLTITGKYISNSVRVFVGGELASDVKVEYASGGGEDGDCHVSLLSPPLRTEGMKSIEVRNPLGGSDVLQDILCYADIDFSSRSGAISAPSVW